VKALTPVNEGLQKNVVEAGLDEEARVGTTPDIKPSYDQVVQLGFITAAMTKLGRWTGDPPWQWWPGWAPLSNLNTPALSL
jgi:hypothetical protein